jgi:molybdopterin converting factor small subunit
MKGLQRTIARVELEFHDGDTVLRFLLRLGQVYPELLAQLSVDERHELRQPIEVAINGAVLGIHYQLNSPMHAGDEILLLPQSQGG